MHAMVEAVPMVLQVPAERDMPPAEGIAALCNPTVRSHSLLAHGLTTPDG